MATAINTAITGVDVTVYLVKDVERAIKFYRDTLGMKVTMDYHGMGAEFTLSDDATFGLYKMHDGSWYPGHGVMFAVPDLDAAVKYYKSRGVKFEDDGKIEDTPTCRFAFAEDSEGNHFMLHSRKH